MAIEINYLYKNGLDILEMADNESGTRVQLLPLQGAQWHAWQVTTGGTTLNLIDHYPDKETLGSELTESYKSAKLSPFACRIPGGRYTFEGKEYEFTRRFADGSAIHGLLFDRSFRVMRARADGGKGEIVLYYAYRGEDAGYPFDYDCWITYRLETGRRLTLITTLRNLSAAPIPVVDGWHPYFRTGTPMDEMELQFNAASIVEFDDRLIPTGRLLPYTDFREPRLIGDRQLDNSFMLDNTGRRQGCILRDPARNIRLGVYPGEGYPVLQLFIPPGRQSIAIESLSGAPNAFNNEMSLCRIPPRGERRFQVTYEASA